MKRMIPVGGLLLLLATPNYGQYLLQRESLKGVTAMRVVIESLPPGGEQDGLTKDQLQTDVELTLRKAGIRVLPEEQSLSPVLYLSVALIKDNELGIYAFDIELHFKQLVSLTRNGKEYILTGTTWHKGTIGIVGIKRLATIRRTSIGDIVNEFLNDYLTENPK